MTPAKKIENETKYSDLLAEIAMRDKLLAEKWPLMGHVDENRESIKP